MGEQDYPGGTIPVCTPELNPVVLDVDYVTKSNYRYQFYLDSRYTGGTSTPINNVIIDLSAELPNLLGYAIGNDGDETIDLQAKAYIDGTLVVDQTRTNQAPGAQPLVLYSLVSSNLAAGSHTLQWILSACLSGTGSYVEYCNNTVTYYAYTAELNAYANSVSIVQDAIEQTWLVGAPGTLTEQAISMVPSIAAYFKFYLVNEGDEDVKMNVGHLVTDHYETGFAVDGAIIDTNEYDVYIAAGGTATITTQSFIPQPPSVAIGPFSILRTRAYESSQNRTPPCGNYGDVNNDGYVTNEDAQLVYNYVQSGWSAVSGSTNISEAEFKLRADTDGDGVVSYSDSMTIGQYVAGTYSTFPVCGAAPV